MQTNKNNFRALGRAERLRPLGGSGQAVHLGRGFLKSNIMKTQIKSLVPLLGILLGVFISMTFRQPSKADPQPKRHGIVILEGQPVYVPSQDGNYIYAGIVLINSSSSQGAPQFPRLGFGATNYIGDFIQLADAVTQVMDQDFRILQTTTPDHERTSTYTFTLVR